MKAWIQGDDYPQFDANCSSPTIPLQEEMV